MAKRHKSAMKRMRQEERRHLRNVSVKSALKTYAKRVESAGRTQRHHECGDHAP